MLEARETTTVISVGRALSTKMGGADAFQQLKRRLKNCMQHIVLARLTGRHRKNLFIH